MSTNTNRVNNPMKVITGTDTRWSYANVWEPKSINGGTPEVQRQPHHPQVRYQDGRRRSRRLFEAAYQEGQAKLKGNGQAAYRPSLPSRLRSATAISSARMIPPMPTAYFINANSATAPGIVDADRNPDADPLRGLLRCVRSRQHQPVCLQQQRQQGHRLRAEQSAADPCRRTPRRQGQCRVRLLPPMTDEDFLA